MAVRAIRGATQVDEDSQEEIRTKTAELVVAVLQRNEIVPDDLISVIFTVTPDLTSDFPAHAARKMGLDEVPLLCATEIPVPGALPRVVRLLAHLETPKSRSQLRHVYLHGATALRQDLLPQ